MILDKKEIIERLKKDKSNEPVMRINGKYYTAEMMALEIESDTPLGRKFLKDIIKSKARPVLLKQMKKLLNTPLGESWKLPFKGKIYTLPQVIEEVEKETILGENLLCKCTDVVLIGGEKETSDNDIIDLTREGVLKKLKSEKGGDIPIIHIDNKTYTANELGEELEKGTLIGELGLKIIVEKLLNKITQLEAMKNIRNFQKN
ncbi:MAG TPA: hypothetical protein VKN14_14170 [Flavobacteriaceae bacterium]|nr:hypothetical protein [Flavobacteriaceae bacterium]